MKYSIYVLFAISFFIISCDNDLEVEPTTITDEDLWVDAALTEAFIINLYTGIRSADKEASEGERNIGFGRGYHWAMYASITDEAVYSNDDQTYLVQRGQLSPVLYGWTSTTWARSYRGIREVNLALQNISLTPLTEERRNRLIAELRFIRAYRYFDLLKGFGGVSIIGDRVTTLEDDDFSELYDRSSISETVDY